MRYSWTTATTNMRGHLEDRHKDEYLRMAEKDGWKIQLPKLRLAEAEATLVQRGDRSRPEFSKEAFLAHLVNFIVADDQVS